jgi:glycosidase
MRGTPFIFQGDEIGMTNMTLNSLDESKDIETQNGWREAQKRGVPATKFLAIANRAGRDNARTPLQWDDSVQAGFSTGTPWMPVNKNKNSINVERQHIDSESVLNYFRRMTALRKANGVLTFGDYLPIETENDKLFAYYRVLDKEKWLIVLNFCAENLNFPQELLTGKASKMIGNYTVEDRKMLRPWEASIYRL